MPTGFVFDPANHTIDFSAVPGFDLSRVRDIFHVGKRKRTCLYGRLYPQSTALGLAEVDGVPVPEPQWVQPTSGKVLKVKVDCAGMAPGDELIVSYDPPTRG